MVLFFGEVADVVKRINHELWMNLKIVGLDKDFIISPDIVRGWMAPDAHFGDTQHNCLGFEFLPCGSPTHPGGTTDPW